MARSLTYDRPLDAKILPNTDNSIHEFRFPTLLEIKKEIENETLDMETGLSAEGPASNSDIMYDDHQREPQSVTVPQHRYDETKESPHPKLVIKLRGLWKNSGQNDDFCRKRKKSECRKLQNEVPKACELQGNKKHRSGSIISSEERVTRSTSSAPKPLANKEKKVTENRSEEKTVTDKEMKEDGRNCRRITRLNKNLNSVCESCGMCFANKKQLLSHKRYYTPDGDFHCTICDIGFSRDFQLARHIRKAHSTLKNEHSYKYKCHVCPDQFDRKTYLIAHVAHLHNKHVVSYKRNKIPDKKITSPGVLLSRGEKRKTFTQRSKSNIKQSGDHSNSITNLKISAGDLRNDGYLTQESSSTQVNNKCSILAKSQPEEAMARQVIQSPINDFMEKPIESTALREIAQKDAPTFRTKISKKSKALRRSQKHSEEKIQVHRSQARLEIASQNLQPQLDGDLVDHFENPVGSWCVSEPLDQPNKTDNISGCPSEGTTTVSTGADSKTGTASRIQCTRSSGFKSTATESSTISYFSSTTLMDEMIRANGKLSTHGKRTNSTHDNYPTSKVDLKQGSESQKLLAQHRQFDQQVGVLLSHQVSDDKAIRENIIADNSFVKCRNAGIDVIHVDDFGGIPESIVVNCKDEIMSDSSCESLSLKVTASSSNGSSTDLTCLDSYGATTLKNHNILNDPKIRDVRVLVVKLENMLNLSEKNSPPKSSSLETSNLVKTEIPDSHRCEKIFTNQLQLGQQSNQKHNCEKVKNNNESISVIQKNRKSANYYPNVPLDHSTLWKSDKLEEASGQSTENRCYFCHTVFGNNFSATSHYLSFHTKIGVFQCCLCYETFKNLRSLRNHLYRNHNACARKRLIKCCVVCKKELSSSSLNQRCSKCDEYPKFRNLDSRGEQFLDTQDLTKNSFAYTLASGKLETSESISMSPLTELRVPMSTEKVESNVVVPVISRESANDNTKCPSKSRKEKLKNFKSLACNRVIFQSSQLTEHLSTLHTGVNKMCRNVVQPQIPVYSESHNCIKKPKKHCKRENTISKSGVKKKTKLKNHKIDDHDKCCKKKLSLRRKLKLSHINSSQRFVRQHRNRRDTKSSFNYKCDVCRLNCCCRQNLEIHKTRYLTTGNNVCNKCGLSFASKHVFVMHMKMAHNSKVLFHGRVRCEVCNQGFYNKKFLRIHLAHFHQMKYFQCRVCRIRFDTYRSLNNHRRSYSKSVNYFCSICDRTFECKNLVKYHTAQAHNRDKVKAYKYTCNTCDFAFVDELLLQAHIGHFHNTQDSEVETQAIDKNIRKLPEQSAKDIELTTKTGNVCIYSNIKMNNSTIPENADKNHNNQEITEHAIGKTVRDRHTSSEYKCNICKLNFTDPYAILNHEWEFSNEGTYACDICNRKFETDSLLKNHKIKHYERNVVRNYECYVCKEDFSKVDHLKMHGLHLHGPQFVWEEGFEATDSQIERARDVILKSLPVNHIHDTLGFMASNVVPQTEKIKVFQKVGNNRSSMKLRQRHSIKDAFCCDFCKTNFSSASLLKFHITKHAYRAYYSNSSRYLCLICKNKFRTNDILRAHVIHCHTANREKQKPDISGAGCSESDADSHEAQICSTYNEALRAAQTLPIIHTIQNQPSTSEKRICIPKLKSTIKRQLSNTLSNVDVLRSDQSCCISLPREIDCDIVSDLGGGDGNNCSGLQSVGITNSGITTHIESKSLIDEVEFFTIKVVDMNRSEKYACSICIEVFLSVAQLRKHFATDHVINGVFLCTLCGKKFSLIANLRNHMVKHKPRNFVCCGKKFEQVTDFICHRFSHDKHTEGKRNGPNLQGSSIDNAVFFEDFVNEPNDSRSDNLWKCEICDEVFLDFEMMLKHWDLCIDTNGLQCDMCRAMFKNPYSLQMHKMTYHKNKQQNRNTLHNRSRLRGNSDRTIQTTTQTRMVHDNSPGNKKSASNSENTHAAQKMERVLASSEKFSKQNELSKYGKIAVQPFAKILQNSKNENECCSNEQNAKSNTTSATEIHPEFTAKKSIGISIECDALKISNKRISNKYGGKKIRLEIKSDASKKTSPQVSKPNKPVPNQISHNVSQNSLLNYFSVRESTKSHKQHSVPNDFSVQIKQNECKEQILLTSQQNSPSTIENLASITSFAHNSNNIDNGRVAVSEFGQKSLRNDYKDKGSLKLPPAASNATGSSSPSNNASGVVYYLRIPSSIDNPDITDNVTIIPSDSSQKPDYIYCHDKMSSGLVPLHLNPSISPTFVVSVPSTSENFNHISNQSIVSNLSVIQYNPSNCSQKRLPPFLSKSSSVVINPVCVFDNNRVTNKVRGNGHENDSGARCSSNDDKSVKVPTPATESTSTHSVLPTSPGNATKDLNSPPSKGASNIEFTQKNHSVRCGYCNLSFTEKTGLVEHVKSHKIDNQCPACGLNFSNETALEQHLPEHKRSACTKCKMVYFFSDSIVYPTGTQKYCSACNTLLPLPTREHNHAMRNSGHQIMKCGICMDEFGTISEMTVHFKQVHSTFVCGICESKFSTKYTLHSHMQTHDTASRETSRCKTCNKYFTGKLDLAYHELSH